MTARSMISQLIAFHCADDEQAEALFDRLADPRLRTEVREEWAEFRAATVQILETS